MLILSALIALSHRDVPNQPPLAKDTGDVQGLKMPGSTLVVSA
jgi:hypothetical protein